MPCFHALPRSLWASSSLLVHTVQAELAPRPRARGPRRSGSSPPATTAAAEVACCSTHNHDRHILTRAYHSNLTFVLTLAKQIQEPFTDNLQCVFGGSGRPTPCWGHMRYVCRCSFFSVSACPLSPSGRSGPTVRQGWCYSSFRAHHPIPARAF